MKIDTRNLNVAIDGFVKEVIAKKAKAVLFLGPFLVCSDGKGNILFIDHLNKPGFHPDA